MGRIVQEVDLKANTGQAEKNVENLNKDLEQTQADLGGIEEAGDKMTGGLISGFKGMIAGVKSAIVGLKTLKGALLATGIGAFILAIGAVSTALTNSEEGQNKFTKWVTQLGVILGNVTDILGNFGNAIINFVTGNFDEAADSIAAVTEGIKNFGEETRKEIQVAGELADMRARADKLERRLQVERAKADRDRAELLEQAVNKEKFSVEERIKFLEEAGRLEEEITNKEIEAARLRLEAKIQENALSASTKEDLDEEAELKAMLIQLETAKLTKQKEVTSQTIALKAEEAAALKAIEDEQKRVKDEQEAADIAKKQEQDKIAAEIQAQEDAKEKERLDIIASEKEARDQAVADREIELEHKRLAAKSAVTNGIIGLFGAESKAGRAALIFKQVMIAQELIAEAKKTITMASLASTRAATATTEGAAQTAKIGFPQNIPMLIGYALQAVGIIMAIKSAVSKTKAIAAQAGGSGSVPSISAPSIPTASVPSSPPDMASVGGSGVNQLASAIGEQNQQPIQAFVVSNDVTTAQSLERNIVDGASIG